MSTYKLKYIESILNNQGVYYQYPDEDLRYVLRDSDTIVDTLILHFKYPEINDSDHTGVYVLGDEVLVESTSDSYAILSVGDSFIRIDYDYDTIAEEYFAEDIYYVEPVDTVSYVRV